MQINLTDTMFKRTNTSTKKEEWCLSGTHQTKVLKEWINPETETRSHFGRFISHFNGKKTYQLFHDKKDPKYTARILHDSSVSELMSYNEKAYGVYLTVNETNGRGRTKKHITRVRAVFADMDDAPVNMAPVMDYNPHLVVQSSPGKFHAYWFCNDVPVDSFEDIQESIINLFGADKNCKDYSRVLRVPGFYHHKKDPKPVFVVHEHDYPVLSFEEVRNIFPPVKRKQFTAKKFKRSDATGMFNGEWGTGEGERNNKLASVIGIMIKEQMTWGDIEADAHKWGSSCSPPLNSFEINKTLNSCKRYVA